MTSDAAKLVKLGFVLRGYVHYDSVRFMFCTVCRVMGEHTLWVIGGNSGLYVCENCGATYHVVRTRSKTLWKSAV